MGFYSVQTSESGRAGDGWAGLVWGSVPAEDSRDLVPEIAGVHAPVGVVEFRPSLPALGMGLDRDAHTIERGDGVGRVRLTSPLRQE